MPLPQSIQQAADYAESIEQSLAQGTTEPAAPQEGHEQDDSADVEKLRARYSSLQGKYNAEVPRLNAQLKELDSRLQQMQKDNESLREELAKREQSKKYLTEQDEQDFGQDMVDLVRRGASEEAGKYAQEAQKLKAQVEQLHTEVMRSRQETEAVREAEFYRTLATECPGWEQQNTEAEFLEWLKETDGVYGFQRNEALQRAYGMWDAHRVAAIFNEYRSKKGSAANPLSRQVAPAHSRGAAQPQGTSARKWTQSAIASFYDAWRRGRIPEEDAKRLEVEILNAVNAGLVEE